MPTNLATGISGPWGFFKALVGVGGCGTISESSGPTNTDSTDSGASFHSRDPKIPLGSDWVRQGEDDPGYTLGPARLVQGHDGSKACPAIAPSFELMGHIQNAILAKRHTEGMLMHLEQRRAEIERRKEDLEAEIVDADGYLEDLEERVAERENGPSAKQEKRMDTLRKRVTDAEAEQAALKVEEEQLTQSFETAHLQTQESEHEVFKILENVCINANLLPSFEEPESQAQPEITFAGLENDIVMEDADADPQPHRAEPEEPQDQPEHPEERVEAARANLFTRQDELQWAQQAFDQHRETYTRQLKDYVNAQVNRPNIDLKAEFDLIYLQRGQEATRKLLDAERTWEQAKAEARDAHVPLLPEQESHFADHPNDGYRLSQEADCTTGVDRDRIHRWLDADMQPHEETEVPESDVGSVVSDGTIFDSVSVINQGPMRRKIDRIANEWRDGRH